MLPEPGLVRGILTLAGVVVINAVLVAVLQASVTWRTSVQADQGAWR
ncbi:hypothetical protein SSAG_00860 [Streptomyces sp. Mg1]|nr:hypothetical protein SSAG_00860 [Streptomyces sp. Mg1]